ncbi:hypothetical protein IMAU60212_01176 [Lactobacillus helveticus]|nr:hypothetical protein [Lactobacillus helveticus]NRO60536.1 hypothetical protein [Lactobacillus helveticus]
MPTLFKTIVKLDATTVKLATAFLLFTKRVAVGLIKLTANTQDKKAYLDNGTVRFIDYKHVKLPKLGIVRIAGLCPLIKERLLNHVSIRIGTASIKKTADDQVLLILAVRQ